MSQFLQQFAINQFESMAFEMSSNSDTPNNSKGTCNQQMMNLGNDLRSVAHIGAMVSVGLFGAGVIMGENPAAGASVSGAGLVLGGFSGYVDLAGNVTQLAAGGGFGSADALTVGTTAFMATANLYGPVGGAIATGFVLDLNAAAGTDTSVQCH
jgi:hypothetical protein